jgi:uncharacterized membrane protein
MTYVKTYAVMLLAFLLVDGAWLGLIAKNMYQRQIGHLMTENVVWGAAFLFYALYIAGIFYFAVLPSGSLRESIIKGALLGGLCYATYDLTNWATLRGWPVSVVVVDILWGMVLTGVIVGIGWWAYEFFSS